MGLQFPYPQWCVLVQAVATAQVEACRLRAQFERKLREVDGGSREEREQAYKFFGDFLVGMPERLRALEGAVQRAALLLVNSGPETLGPTMPVQDLKVVEDVTSRRASKRPRLRLGAAGFADKVGGALLVIDPVPTIPAGCSSRLGRAQRMRAAAILIPLARYVAARAGGSFRVQGWEALTRGGATYVRLWGIGHE